MIALTLLAAAAGTTFSCEVGPRAFVLFAPDAEVVAQHGGEPAALYTLEGTPFGETAAVDQVLDGLPFELFVSLADDTGSPIEIEINQLDDAAMTAKAAVTEDLTPASARATIVRIEGSCTFARKAAEDGQ